MKFKKNKVKSKKNNIKNTENLLTAKSMLENLIKIANDRETNLETLLKDFISDLENSGNPEYEQKIPEIEIKGNVHKGFVSDAKEYFNRVIKKLEVEKEKAWQSICSIVDRECSRPDLTDREYLKNTVMYWNEIKDKVVLPENTDKNVFKISDPIREYIVGLIDAEIYANEEELYYKEVEYFTKGFSFLASDLEFHEAISGKSGRKFIDLKSYNRFYDLRTQLQKNGGEYSQICKLLKINRVDETTKKILTERKMVMEAEKAKKAAEFVGDSAR